MKSIKILVVEDDKDLCDMISDLLMHSKYTAHRAYNFNNALKLLTENHYKLLITDNKLGNASGLDLIKFAKKEQPDLKVFIITAYGSDELFEKANEFKVDYVIDKPFDVYDLVKKVNRCF